MLLRLYLFALRGAFCMRAVERGLDAGASGSTAVRESVSAVTADRGSNDDQWFADAARQLLSPDAGLALHYLTGLSESACYRAARGDNLPPLHYFRKLLRGPQGWTWLAVIMDGSNEEWWLELQLLRDTLIKQGIKIVRR